MEHGRGSFIFVEIKKNHTTLIRFLKKVCKGDIGQKSE